MARSPTSRRPHRGHAVTVVRWLGVWLAWAGAACAPAAKPAPSATASHGTRAPATEASALTEGEDAAPPPPDSGPSEPVYVAVRGAGVLKLEGDRFAPVFETQSGLVDLALGPSGTLFASFYDVGTIAARAGTVRSIARAAYSRLNVIADDDIWATPDPFEWAVHHYDGKRWSTVKRRGEFSGQFDDNKLNGLVALGGEVWVSSWNGLFRGVARKYELVDLGGDTGSRPPWQLATRGDRLVARFESGWFERNSGDWRKLSWPRAASIQKISDADLAVGVDAEQHDVVSGVVDGRVATIDVASAGHVADVTIDDRGRVWVAGDYSLVVFDPRGRVLASYEPGTLAGVIGKIQRIAVYRHGPARLPRKVAAATRELRGSVKLYRSGRPLSGALVELCPSAIACSGASWKRTATTAADGSFRLRDVPPGDFVIHVAIPAGLPDCATPFTQSPGRPVAGAKECPAPPGAPCDVSTVLVCLPFELPPKR